jgi:Neocarzinostatin family
LRTKILTGVAGAALALGAIAAPAFAGTVSVNPSSNLSDGTVVQVTLSGFAGQNVSIAECSNSVANPSFDPFADCDGDTSRFVPTNATGDTIVSFTVFEGEKPLLGWACGTSNDPVNNPVRPCFIRAVGLSLGNRSGEAEQAITFAVAPPVPEVPYAVLLPLGAVGAIGAGIFLNRRKQVAA